MNKKYMLIEYHFAAALDYFGSEPVKEEHYFDEVDEINTFIYENPLLDFDLFIFENNSYNHITLNEYEKVGVIL